MVVLDLVREKLRRIRGTQDALRGVMPDGAAGLEKDRDRLDLVAFRVYLLMQEAIDLASHVISDQGWGPAPSLREHFVILIEHQVIPAELGTRLAAGIKVRNLIGHAYVDIDPAKMYEAAQEVLLLVEPYCAAVLAYGETHAT